jgi:hypothetical protein
LKRKERRKKAVEKWNIQTTGFVPRKFFLTKGVGYHKEELASFELALRDAKIGQFNLVNVALSQSSEIIISHLNSKIFAKISL